MDEVESENYKTLEEMKFVFDVVTLLKLE